MNCQKCGAPIEEGYSFCMKCGAKVETGENTGSGFFGNDSFSYENQNGGQFGGQSGTQFGDQFGGQNGTQFGN